MQNEKFIVTLDPGYSKLGICVGRYYDKKILVSNSLNLCNQKKVLKKILLINDFLCQAIESYTPNIACCGYEKQVFSTRKRDVDKVYFSIGLFLKAIAYNNPDTRLFTIPPTQIKKHISGDGAADKNKVIRSVKKIYYTDLVDVSGFIRLKDSHCADAIALYDYVFTYLNNERKNEQSKK
jgi:Holliday junction resolvasome RuvABC endonuclease subunit